MSSINVPDLTDWPSWANSFQCFYTSSTDPQGMGQRLFSGVKIDRPAPPWMPKVTEPVFVKVNHDSVGIVIADSGNGTFLVRRTNGTEDTWDVSLLKPFSIAGIGKNWKDV